MEPAQRLLEFDLESPEFRSGAGAGMWGLAHHQDVHWPRLLVWLAAPPRTLSPDRYHVLLNVEGYRSAPPSGTFVDPQTLSQLSTENRPKGKEGSRFERVFRTDWEGARAFYHPYDRVASSSHANWVAEMPAKIWSPNHTIVDWLDEFYGIFQSEDYLGVHSPTP